MTRFVLFLAGDLILLALSIYFAFLLRFEWVIPGYYPLLKYIPIFIIIKVPLLFIFRLYSISWRFAGFSESLNLVKALALGTVCITIFAYAVNPARLFDSFPRTVILLDFMLSLILVGAFRLARRSYLHLLKKHTGNGKRTLIVGAGNTGEMILRDMARLGHSPFNPVCLLDDNTKKIGMYMHGVQVCGNTDELGSMIVAHGIEMVVIAIPSLNHKKLREMYDTAQKANIKSIKIVPRIYDFDKPDINLRGLEDISIEDLIGRQTVEIDRKIIREFLNDKIVLVSGAGGSIGSEMVIQVFNFEPEKMVLFDIDETELHNLGLKLNRLFPHLSGQIEYVTGDVRDEARLAEVFEAYRPQIVFHAAAYKHVPMMEYNPKEAVKVNIIGTYNLAKAAAEYGVEKFIMISTDKAVRPTSIMGATKRMAEYVCKAMNGNAVQCSMFNVQCSNPTTQPLNHSTYSPDSTDSTRFISVRFGNVLGSRGSVLPLFLEQLKHGGPLTVTHKDMKRYFMTIPEAVSLVLQASTMGEGGEVFVLDMGEPVMITDIAEELIRLHGLEPYKDIDIEFTGLRPGEKLFEEILTAEEGTVASKHEKVFVAMNSEKYSMEEIEEILKEFRALIAEPSIGNDGRVRELLKRYVKHYEK
jgi:FlaA1/EpsC-like NDP-sugar epimerase